MNRMTTLERKHYAPRQENTRSWSFLQVGACKLRGHSLLPIAAGEFKEL